MGLVDRIRELLGEDSFEGNDLVDSNEVTLPWDLKHKISSDNKIKISLGDKSIEISYYQGRTKNILYNPTDDLHNHKSYFSILSCIEDYFSNLENSISDKGIRNIFQRNKELNNLIKFSGMKPKKSMKNKASQAIEILEKYKETFESAIKVIEYGKSEIGESKIFYDKLKDGSNFNEQIKTDIGCMEDTLSEMKKINQKYNNIILKINGINKYLREYTRK